MHLTFSHCTINKTHHRFIYIITFKFMLNLTFRWKHFNPLNAKLNAICHFLALLGAHHILHISRIRVK